MSTKTQISQLIRAASSMGVKLPSNMLIDAREELILAAAARNVNYKEATLEEKLDAIKQVVEEVGPHNYLHFDKFLLPATPLQALQSLPATHSIAAAYLAEEYASTIASKSRHEIFNELLTYVEPYVALKAVARCRGAKESYHGSPEKFWDMLTAADAAVLLAVTPADASYEGYLERKTVELFNAEDTFSMVTFGGQPGTVLAVLSGAMSAEASAFLAKKSSEADLLKLLRFFKVRKAALSELAQRPAAKVTAAILECIPSEREASDLMWEVPLEDKALLKLAVTYPDNVTDSNLRHSMKANSFSGNFLVEWAKESNAFEVDLGDMADQGSYFSQGDIRNVALHLKGGAAKVKQLTADGEHYLELAAYLKAAHEIFGGETRLWTRLATATPSSPFGDKNLSLLEATNLYWDRWNAAEARRNADHVF